MDEPDQSKLNDSAAAEKSSMSEDPNGFSETDATVLTPMSALSASELPTGMTPRELAHTLQGEMLDHYKLQQFVGGGGMGVVFRALDTTLDRVVAVKVVASRSINSEDLQRRFLVEAQSAARLDHPNIARVYDSGRSRGLPYIVFEYIEGANIRDLVVNNGPLSIGDALSYTYQIAHALSHAWEREVVHRDIKPSNILVNQEGMAKLVDMGLARLYQVGAQEDDLTSTGVTLGTFDYISPEQARNPKNADTRSDIYSLGCTLFYMLVGHAPFSEGTAAQKLLQHQEEEAPELTKLRGDVPESLSRLVKRMLAKQPAKRPQTSSEVVSNLAVLIQELGLQLPHALAPTPITVAPPILSRWRNHIPWVMPLLLIALAGLWMNRVADNSGDQSLPAIKSFEEERRTSPSANAITENQTPPSPSNEASPSATKQLINDISDSQYTEMVTEGIEESSTDTPVKMFTPSDEQITIAPEETDMPMPSPLLEFEPENKSLQPDLPTEADVEP